MNAKRLAERRTIVPHPSDPTLALVPLSRGRWAVIDAADVSVVSGFTWCIAGITVNTAYAAAHVGYRDDGTRIKITLHRLIADRMGIDAPRIDHRDGNGLDCRRSNIRAATAAQNAHNVGLRRDSTSGIKGVNWHVRHRKWVAVLEHNRTRHIVGEFDTKDAAAVAVANARARLHGEFANHGTNQEVS